MLDGLPPARCPYVAAISLWELATLVERKRVVLRQGFEAWIDVAAAPETVTIVDVSPAIAKDLVHFPKGFHHDPADRVIVATARALDLPLLTRDRTIRRSGLVRLWRG